MFCLYCSYEEKLGDSYIYQNKINQTKKHKNNDKITEEEKNLLNHTEVRELPPLQSLNRTVLTFNLEVFSVCSDNKHKTVNLVFSVLQGGIKGKSQPSSS